MEEKERYYYKKYAGDYDILDRNDKNAYYGAISRDEEDAQNLINLLNQQDKRIKELEQENQQLKQSQKQLADVEAKLAESEEQLKEELVEKKGLERALSACNRQNDEFAEMIKKLVREKEELKEQLANQNQDQQITELRELHAIKDDASDCITINGVKFSYEQMLIIGEVNNNYRMNIKKLNQQLEQSQKQLAISELEKIYNLFEPYENSQKDTILCANNGISFVDYLENQIKSLKGEEQWK